MLIELYQMLTYAFPDRKLIFLVVPLLLLSMASSCQTKKTDLTGRYESKSGNIIYRLLNIVEEKNRIEINKDSTFEYETCGNRITGYWKVFNDSLFLYCTENKYKIDSLNIVGYNGKTKLKCGDGPAILLISKEKLYEDIRYKGSDETIHLLYEKRE